MKNFYEDQDKVEAYLKMTEGYNGRMLVEVLTEYAPEGFEVLELGMGQGKDLDILKEHYEAVGSDKSKLFLEMYRKKHPDADLIHMNAITMNTDREFDVIYSNKVLMHLSKEELEESIAGQYRCLREDGIIFHSFWKGEGVQTFEGLRFQYYEEDELVEMFSPFFHVLEVFTYAEDEADDSIGIVAAKRFE